MTVLITTAALLVLATIAISLYTASELQSQRQRLAKLEQAALEVEQELEDVEEQKKAADGSLGLHEKLRDEKLARIDELNEELEFLKEDRVSERDIKVAGARAKNFSLDDDDEGDA